MDEGKVSGKPQGCAYMLVYHLRTPSPSSSSPAPSLDNPQVSLPSPSPFLRFSSCRLIDSFSTLLMFSRKSKRKIMNGKKKEKLTLREWTHLMSLYLSRSAPTQHKYIHFAMWLIFVSVFFVGFCVFGIFFLFWLCSRSGCLCLDGKGKDCVVCWTRPLSPNSSAIYMMSSWKKILSMVTRSFSLSSHNAKWTTFIFFMFSIPHLDSIWVCAIARIPFEWWCIAIGKSVSDVGCQVCCGGRNCVNENALPRGEAFFLLSIIFKSNFLSGKTKR